MSAEPNIEALLAAVTETRRAIEARDGPSKDEFNRLSAQVSQLITRPYPGGPLPDADEREEARDWCIERRMLDRRYDEDPPEPSYSDIETAMVARRELRQLWRHARPDKLETRSLSAFSFGSNDFVLPPTISNRVLSCLEDRTDVAGLVGQEIISGASLKLPRDETEWDAAGWECEANCFANNPTPSIAGLGWQELRPDPLRYVVCVTKELLEDSVFNLESWIAEKVDRAFRKRIGEAIMVGDGNGKPEGILAANSPIQVCNSASDRTGEFTWQDLILLAMQVPAQWHAGASFMMNQRTLALVLTMSDAAGRPIMLPTPITEAGQAVRVAFSLLGWPVVINSYMPDCVPGSTPVAFGNWQEAYKLVRRQATTMQPDPYSGGFCQIYRFSTRIGGQVLCANAARLLRVP